MDEAVKVINIRSVIRNSKSGFLRSLPGFIIRAIEKLIYQDEMNATIYKFRDKTGVPFINDILNEWNVKIEIKGGENIPSSGNFIFVANHSVGAMDSLAFLSMIHRFYPNVVSPSNELFEYIPNLHPVILGINVFAKNTRETIEKLNTLFETDAQIMIFPSGEVSRRKKGEIIDPVWQKSFITKAVQYKKDVIPVHISGKNSNLFYNIANLRKFLGIKLYVETVLLPREMLKQKNLPVTLTIGKVIPYQTFTREKTDLEWAQFVKETVYKIIEQNN